MSYEPKQDFLALVRRTKGGARIAQMPGLDYVVEALARAGMVNVVVSQFAPVVDQSSTVWVRPAFPSWSAESTILLWDADASAYAVATPALWSALIGGINIAVPGGADNSVQFNDNGAFNGFGSWDGSTFTVPGAGTFTGDVTAADYTAATAGVFNWLGRTRASASADGSLLLTNNAGNDFNSILLGGVSNSFPAIHRNGAAVQIVLAGGGGSADLSARNFTADAAGVFQWSARGVVSSPAVRVVQIGPADAAAPAVQTLRFQNVAAGQLNTAAPNAFIQAPTGSGSASGGELHFQVAPAGGSGTGQNAWADSLVLYGNLRAMFAGPLGLGAAPVASSRLLLGASTTLLSLLNLPVGVAPTAPNDGDVWRTTDGIFWRDGTNTRPMNGLRVVGPPAGNYTILPADYDTMIYVPTGGCTINVNVIKPGQSVVLRNLGTSQTLTAGAGVTMYKGGALTPVTSVNLSSGAMATLTSDTLNQFNIQGSGVT